MKRQHAILLTVTALVGLIFLCLLWERLLAPLRPENLANFKNLDTKFTSPPYDRGNKYSVPYQWGTVGILVRPAAGKPVPEVSSPSNAANARFSGAIAS